MHQDYATITAAIPLLAHPTPQQVLGARLTVACHARTPDDCRLLLDVLGLDTTTAGPWQRPQQPLNSPPMNQNDVPPEEIAERHVTGDLADQLTEHREAIAYALRHTLTSWADATGRSEGTAAGTLHRALSWVTGHPTPPRDIPHEVTTLGLEVEDYRGATARVEAHLEHLTRRLEQLARRVDDLETTVNREDDQ